MTSTPGTSMAASHQLWSRRVLLGLPVLVAVAGCSIVPNPYKEEDDAVAAALSSEPMWVTYLPAWVTKESSHLGWRSAADVEGERTMQSFRLLYGVVPAGAAAAARAAATQAGWSAPNETDFLQLRRAQGGERSVLLRLSITATDAALGVTINGSFG